MRGFGKNEGGVVWSYLVVAGRWGIGTDSMDRGVRGEWDYVVQLRRFPLITLVREYDDWGRQEEMAFKMVDVADWLLALLVVRTACHHPFTLHSTEAFRA